MKNWLRKRVLYVTALVGCGINSRSSLGPKLGDLVIKA